MSGFLLAWHRDGGPVPERAFAVARRRRTPPFVTPRELRLDGVAAWHWPSDWAPGAEEGLPLHTEGAVLAGTLRLDARDRQWAALREAARPGERGDEAASHAARPGDDALAMAALSAWDAEAPTRWIGDYAVAHLDAARGRLHIMRGVVGVRSCFHARSGPIEWVSDDPALLAWLIEAPATPEAAAVTEYLAHGQLTTPTRSFHRGVRAIPTAHTLTIHRDGRERLSRHWSFPVPAVVEGRTDDDVVAGFHAVLDAAVRSRLRGPRAAILLSGGLDSTTLAVAARRAAPAVRLTAITAGWSRLLPDEEPALAAAAAGRLGLAHRVHEFAPEEGLPGASVGWTPEPVPDAEGALWRGQAARIAAEAPVVLNGEDMDALLAPPTLATLLRSQGLGRVVAAWRAYARDTGRRPWIGLRTTLGLAGRRAPRIPGWLKERPRPGRVTPRGMDPTSDATWAATCWLDDPVMSGSDLVVLLPFTDVRVLEFLGSLPAIPWRQRKHLLRVSGRALLPDAILHRAKTPLRGYYEARVARWRATADRAALERRVADMVSPWVDVTAWRRTLADARSADDTVAAWRVIELARWLAQEGSP